MGLVLEVRRCEYGGGGVCGRLMCVGVGEASFRTARQAQNLFMLSSGEVVRTSLKMLVSAGARPLSRAAVISSYSAGEEAGVSYCSWK